MERGVAAGKQDTDTLATHPEISLVGRNSKEVAAIRGEPQPEEFGAKTWQKNQEVPSRNVKRKNSASRNKKIREPADSNPSSKKLVQS